MAVCRTRAQPRPSTRWKRRLRRECGSGAIAVETIVVVRLLAGDDARQTVRAATLFRTEETWLSKTVILDTEWDLRSLYHFRGAQPSAAILALTNLPTVRVEDPAAVSQALEWASLEWILPMPCTLQAEAKAPNSRRRETSAPPPRPPACDARSR